MVLNNDRKWALGSPSPPLVGTSIISPLPSPEKTYSSELLKL